MNARLLIQMSGMPGAGKSTMAREIRSHIDAVILDMDVCKSAALDSGVDFETSGRVAYMTLWALARSILNQGSHVILDSPCRFQWILDNGLQAAADTGAHYRYIECITEDMATIRRRLQNRPRYRSQVRDIDDLPVSTEEGAEPMSAEERFLYWTHNMVRPSQDYLRLDTSRPVANCLADVLAFLQIASA
ncbi:MAG: hypothetical protein ETSY2_21825 [Candidatus Entotheonella gemina]|uniref:ATP-binding protein n=1 Tax=Candidatus Entotheonella gemina TaxID=1429439 RepID=W4M7K3_9BACT|nr:MAG: hypothetical protein ETSY2_21825 [Candidatus Entotheonella gemina]